MLIAASRKCVCSRSTAPTCKKAMRIAGRTLGSTILPDWAKRLSRVDTWAEEWGQNPLIGGYEARQHTYVPWSYFVIGFRSMLTGEAHLATAVHTLLCKECLESTVLDDHIAHSFELFATLLLLLQ